MSERIAIIGHFGGNQDFTDGQTVKTKILFAELSTKTNWDITRIDTYWKSKKPALIILQTLKALLSKKKIIVLLSINGMKFFFPLLSFFARHWNSQIYHDVIGGNLDQHVSSNPKFVKYLNSFKVNWVETNLLKSNLEKAGICNCVVIPNFKRLKINEELKETTNSTCVPFRFCTFSRVMKEKGIEEAIKAIQEINESRGREICTLDIYGKIDSGYEQCFEKTIESATSAIRYCGTVAYDDSVDTIKGYYALLFPTYWKGEGFPGTIVDAFSSGLPVIASDWNSNKEIVSSGVNGIVYPSSTIKTLKEGIEWMINNPNEVMKYKRNCIQAALHYQPDVYISQMVSCLEEA